MSDNIAKFDGKDAMAYSGRRPWHSLGTKVPGLMTVAEATKAGNLDWEVTKEPIMLANPSMAMVSNFYATVRNGPEKEKDGSLKQFPLGVVGERYHIVQNSEAFEFFDHAIGEKVACIETVGALGTGAVVFIMARVPSDFEAVKGDPIERYILLTTSHDGSGSIMATFTPIRVVCQNTLNAALSGSKNIVKIRHTKSAKQKLEQAHKVLSASDAYWTKLGEAYKFLAMKDMTRLDVMNFIEEMFPSKTKELVKDGKKELVEEVSTRTKNIRSKVLRLFDGEAAGSNFAPGTRYQMLNSITEYVDWGRSTRKGTNQWESSVFGSQAGQIRQKAINLLLV